MKYFFLLLFPFFLFSCSKDEVEDCNLLFIGDSMIANWDVERYFPNRIIENRGIDGIGISELSNIPVVDLKTDVIVLIGTNDIHNSMTDKDILTYALSYIEEITRLGGKRLFLLSVLPTSHIDKNEKIELFNKNIETRVNQIPNIVYIGCYYDFLRDGKLKVELSRDGIHLNDYGYMFLANLLRAKL